MDQSKEELNYYQSDASSSAASSDEVINNSDEQVSDDLQELLNNYLGVSEELQGLIADYLEMKTKRKKRSARSKTNKSRTHDKLNLSK